MYIFLFKRLPNFYHPAACQNFKRGEISSANTLKVLHFFSDSVDSTFSNVHTKHTRENFPQKHLVLYVMNESILQKLTLNYEECAKVYEYMPRLKIFMYIKYATNLQLLLQTEYIIN